MADQLSSDLASLKIRRDVDPDLAGRRRTWIVVAIAAVVLLAAGVATSEMLRSRLSKPEVELTEIRMVSPAQSSVEVTSTGYVVAQMSSKVGAKLLGRVSDVKVREGSKVTAGDVLVEIEAAEQRAAVGAARARLLAAKARAATARANLSETKRQYERERGLAEQGASARSIAEDLEARVASLAESVKAADADADAVQAELAALEVNLQYSTIRAPIDGVVMGKPVEVGELVGPQTPAVLELADFSTLMVETDVPEGRLHLVKIASPAEIVLDAYPSKRHRGEVAEISPRVNRAKATVVVKVRFVDAAEGVLPDMAARVSFLSAALDEASMKEPPKKFVPAAAIVDRDGAKVVFRIDETGKARMVAVKLGPAMGTGFELQDGPREGTKVVSNPPKSLADGQAIKERTR